MKKRISPNPRIGLFRRFMHFLGAVFLVFIILSLVAFAVVKHLKIKEIVEEELEHTLGINVTIDEIYFSPLLVHIGAKGVTIHNPSGFPEDELAYLEYIHFVIDPLEILIRKDPDIYLTAVRLDRLNIIQNKQGMINIEELIPIKEKENYAGPDKPFYFDVVILSVGTVRYADYRGTAKKERIYPINMKEAMFVGVKNEDEVTKAIIAKAIENTDIGKLINLTIVPVVTQVHATASAAWGTATSGAKSVVEIVTFPFKLVFGMD